jgi:HTH-type transcriptional regulator / antitoxin HigA
MSLSFNSAKYQELLAEYQPKLIKTEAENEHALTTVEKLMHLQNRSPEQNGVHCSRQYYSVPFFSYFGREWH